MVTRSYAARSGCRRTLVRLVGSTLLKLSCDDGIITYYSAPFVLLRYQEGERLSTSERVYRSTSGFAACMRRILAMPLSRPDASDVQPRPSHAKHT